MELHKKNLLSIRILTILLTISLAVVSIFGVFVEKTYEREVASMAAQGAGQDLVDLILVVPLMVFSMIFMQKGSKIATFLFGGTVLYTLYSFVIYALGVHFNNLFLLYCLTLGCSFYLFTLYLLQFNKVDVKEWFTQKVPVRLTGIFFILIAAIFYMMWLKDVVPALLNDTVPESVSDYDLLVNPVHVLDIAIMLPGLVITAVLLMKGKKLGYIFAPILLVFIIILAIALAAMIVMLKVKGVSDDISVGIIFIVLALISSIFLVLFLGKLKN